MLSQQSIRNNSFNEVIERRLMATHPPATAGGTDLFQVGAKSSYVVRGFGTLKWFGASGTSNKLTLKHLLTVA